MGFGILLDPGFRDEQKSRFSPAQVRLWDSRTWDVEKARGPAGADGDEGASWLAGLAWVS